MRPSRRDILRALGLSTVMGPFLPYFNREAEAQTGYPTRLLLVFTGNGSVSSKYWPTGTGADYAFAPGSITESLAPFKSKLIFPKGLKRVQTGPGGHESAMVPTWTASSRNPGEPFGGYSSQASVDQIIAKGIPNDTPFPSLEFGVMSDGKGANARLLSVMSYAGSDQPIKPESSPYAMFDRLMTGTGTDPGIPPEELERLRLRRQSSLDLVRNELRALSPKLDVGDRIKLEQHVEGLAAIERRLVTPPTGVPTNPTEPRAGIDLKANENFPEVLKIQNSLAVSALASNRTRVASLMWGRSFSMIRHTWVGVDEEHHTLSHEEESSVDAQAKKQAIETWFMQQMADLLTQLDSVSEGDGTLLDNTMLIYVNELSSGAAHRASDSQTGAISLIAGSGGKKLRTGQLLELGPTHDWAQLLCTACHVMGLPNITKVGDMGKEGIIPSLLV